MNKNIVIYNSLTKKNKLDFIKSCYAKKLNNCGIPREFPSNLNLGKFLELPIEHYKKIDSYYFPLICDEDIDDFLCDKEKPLFDYCRCDFRKVDEIFEFLDSNQKKLHNLYLRNIEKKRFILSNTEHLKKHNLAVTQAIEQKLIDVWQSKWDRIENYINYESSSLENMIYD